MAIFGLALDLGPLQVSLGEFAMPISICYISTERRMDDEPNDRVGCRIVPPPFYGKPDRELRPEFGNCPNCGVMEKALQEQHQT